MNPFLSLIPIGFIMAIGSYLSYQRNIKDSSGFLIVMIALAVSNAVLWVNACRWCDSQRQLYSLSIAIDCVTVISYSVLPLLVCGVRLSPIAIVGVIMVVTGAILVKFG